MNNSDILENNVNGNTDLKSISRNKIDFTISKIRKERGFLMAVSNINMEGPNGLVSVVPSILDKINKFV